MTDSPEHHPNERTEASAGRPRDVILLVDDDPLIIETFGMSLREAGFPVVVASNGAQALRICVESPPSLAVIDYSMPGLSGVDLARQLVVLTDVPFLFLSAHADPTVVQAAVAAGAMTYLVKPLDGAHLVPAIHTALQRSREVLALRSEAERLSAAVKIDHAVGVATGLVMARYRITKQSAFERLRRHARSRRVRLEEVANELVRATDEAGKFYELLDGNPTGPR